MIQGVDNRVPRVAYTIEDAAAALAVSPRTVMRMLKRGDLRPFYIGRSVRILVADLKAYTRAGATQAP